jgi:hypothetical protein
MGEQDEMGVPHLVRALHPAVDLRTQQRERDRLAPKRLVS